MTLFEFVKQQVDFRIQQIEEEARKADTSPDGVHDLRVAIRRLSEVLRVCDNLFPEGAAAIVRKDLRSVMRVAGEVRNHDIAAELLAKASLGPSTKIEEGRVQMTAKLARRLGKWNSGVPFQTWKELLHA